MAKRSTETAKQSCAIEEESEEELEIFTKITVSNEIYRLTGGMDITASDSGSYLSDRPEDDNFGTERTRFNKILRKIFANAQQFFLFLCWLTFTYFLMTNEETEYKATTLSVPKGVEGLEHMISKNDFGTSLSLRIYGPFIKTSFRFNDLKSSHQNVHHLAVSLYEIDNTGAVRKLKKALHLHLLDYEMWQKGKMEKVEKILEDINVQDSKYKLHFISNSNHTLPLQMAYQFTMVSKTSGLILAVILLVLLYMLIMFELVHRTLAGVICSTLAVGIIAAVNLRPSLPVVFLSWGNVDTVMLFFGFSILVEIITNTGLQDHLAARCYELSNGHIWPMLHYVLLAAWLLSIVLDDIFLVLLIAPICLRLCEIMHLDCTPVLSCLIIALNVGSTLTPISTISYSIIENIALVQNQNITLGEFVLHMLPATLLALVQSYLQLRIQFHDSNKMRSTEPFQVTRLKHLINVWHRASQRMGDYTWDDSLARKTVHKRITNLRRRLKRLGRMPEKPTGFEEIVQDLKDNFPLKNIELLVVCILALLFISIMSILSDINDIIIITIGWIAILAALMVLSLTIYEDLEGMLARIDWSTMLFFVTLSIVLQVLISLGLLENIGLLLEYFIVNVSSKHRLMVAILGIIWISAILTTFIHNIPVAEMMLRIIGTLSLNKDMTLPIMPLVWSLTLGCALGGNGSIVAAFANIACAGVATRHGFKLTFLGYFKIGFFVMLGNVLVASVYLLLAHVVFQWH